MKMDAQLWIYMLVGIIGGICVSMEGSLNSLLGRHVGVLKATIAPFAGGLLAILLTVLIVGSQDTSGSGNWASAPWYSYLGGVAAAVFVGSIIFITPKVGIAAAFSAILVGQFAASLVIDAAGWFATYKIPVTLPRIAGLILLIVGMRLFFVTPGD